MEPSTDSASTSSSGSPATSGDEPSRSPSLPTPSRPASSRSAGRAVAVVDEEHGVTPRELFFDLVFVFAFTQVTTLLTHDPTFAGIGHAVLVLAALWWPWTGYAWLTNTVDPEEGLIGAALLVALIAMFVAALAVPHVFGDDGVLFGVAFLIVVAIHLSLYALAGRHERDLLLAVLRLAPWTLGGATLILVAGFADGARTWLWVAALVCTYVGAALAGTTGWRVFPSHLAERYWLVLIIALGEAFVAIGIGVGKIGLGEVAAAILGLLVATSFWLAYFDFFSIRGERMLADASGPDRIGLFAFAMKTIIGHVHQELDYAVAFALCGGCALYVLTFSAVRSRVERRFALSRGRFAAAVAFLLVLPLATAVPAIAALGLVTVIWVALHAYELVWWRQARAESRSMLASS